MLQQLLTYTFEVIALTGFIGILISYISTQLPVTRNLLPVKQLYTVHDSLVTAKAGDSEPEINEPMPESKTPTIPDPWELPITTNSSRWGIRQAQSVKPVLVLCPASEPVKNPTQPTKLKSLDSVTLRKLCSQYGINWRNVRGKGKHMLKEAMIAHLETHLEQIVTA